MYGSYKKAKRRKDVWPPAGSPLVCPDYWVNKGDGLCENPFLMGTGDNNSSAPMPSKNFSNYNSCAGSKTNDKECLNAKCKWARRTNNPWFGVLPGCSKGQNCYCPG